MALLALQDGSAGIGNPTFTAATAGGDTMPGGTAGAGWSLPIVLVVKNAHTASWTVTVADHPAVVVPAGATAVIPVSGGVYYKAIKAITYSGVTALTVAAVRLASAA